jgi:enterochelin esterase-like enzyme
LLGGAPSSAQVSTNTPPQVPGAKTASVQHIKVHGRSLESNLEGESPDRDVVVILPPGYSANAGKRYPVVYALHGYSIGAEQWTHEIHVPQTVEGAFAKGSKPMIIVLPDSKTAYGGSMYSSSVTTGDFENFIAHDLVAYVDAHYRTIPDRRSRGLAGHSMGGYGVARIGMKHPDVFGALYLMSPGLSIRPADPVDAQGEAALKRLRSPADAADLPFPLKAQLAVAAAWSPNPANPPLYLDLPAKDGAPRAEILAKWDANAPLSFVDQYVDALRQYRAIAMDVGDQDSLGEATARFHAVLDSYHIPNTFEVYSGTHTSNVAFRFQDAVIPFFSRHLAFTSAE